MKHETVNRPPLVLVIDDEPINFDLLKRTLRYPYYKVAAACGASEALEMLADGLLPDIILLDVMMPGMDGFETCRLLKENPQTREIPVIFITAKSDSESESRALEIGAVDFISKPLSSAKVRARVKTHLELHSVRRELERKNRSLLHDQRTAEAVVRKMASSNLAPTQGTQTLSLSLDPTCGDIALSAQTVTGERYVLLGDFTGHGLPAAIGSCLISYMFESLVNKALPLNDFLEVINTELYKRLPSHIFMAASLLHIDRHNNHIRVRASNCGMPDILHLRGSTTLFCGKSGHSPLGIQPEVDFTQNFYEFEAKPGDRIYLQTDGAVEAMTESGEPFGQERLELFLHSDAPLSSLQQTLENFTGSNGLHDDLSLMEIKI